MITKSVPVPFSQSVFITLLVLRQLCHISLSAIKRCDNVEIKEDGVSLCSICKLEAMIICHIRCGLFGVKDLRPMKNAATLSATYRYYIPKFAQEVPP